MGVLRNVQNWYAKIARAGYVPVPPYRHVIQIGDPRLRKISEPVPLDRINTFEIQNILSKLELVLNNYNAVGISAPQIGINYRIFAMKFSIQDLYDAKNEVQRQIQTVPYTVFINPMLSVTNNEKVVQQEGCVSVRSFIADVARYKEVQVTGYNAQGEPVSQLYNGWAARIAQHEMDHLEGKLYTDVMDRKTLSCTCWHEINLARGKVHIPFGPS